MSEKFMVNSCCFFKKRRSNLRKNTNEWYNSLKKKGSNPYGVKDSTAKYHTISRLMRELQPNLEGVCICLNHTISRLMRELQHFSAVHADLT